MEGTRWCGADCGAKAGPAGQRLPSVDGFLGRVIAVGQNAIGIRHLPVVLTGFRVGQHLLDDQAGIGADGALDLLGNLRIVLEELLGVLAALADALAIVGEPGTRFLRRCRP